MKIHYPRADEMIVEPERDGYRVINLNHETFHLVDQHGVVVIDDPEGEDGLMGYCHGGCNNPATAEPHVSVYVDNIRKAIGTRIQCCEEEIAEKLGHPLDDNWREGHVRAYTRNTTTHEVGHAIGIEHHHTKPCMPPGATQDSVNPSYGSYTCVMRYLYDLRFDSVDPPTKPYPQQIKEHDDVLDILKEGWPWPDTYCDFCTCRAQIRISDAVP